MLRVNDSGNAAGLLRLCNGMDGQGGFTGAFRSVNFYDAAFGITADTQGVVQGDGAAGDYLGGVPFRLVSQLHDGAFPVVFLNFVDGCLKGLEFGGIHLILIHFFCCFCHNFI